MDEDKIINLRFGEISDQPSSPDDKRIGVTREGHPVYERKDGTKYLVYPEAQAKAWWGPAVRARLYEDYGYDANDPIVADKLREYHTNPDGTIDWSSFPVSTPWQAALIQARKNPNWRLTYGMTPSLADFNAVTGNIFNPAAIIGNIDWSKLLSGFTNAVMTAAMAEDPEVATASGWKRDANGNWVQEPDAATLLLMDNLEVISWMSPTHPGTAAIDYALKKAVFPAVGYVARNTIKPAFNKVVKPAFSKARNYFDYISRVNYYNNAGKLLTGFPFTAGVTEDAANIAMNRILAAQKAGKAIDPIDGKIVKDFFGWSDAELAANIRDSEAIRKINLLDRLYGGLSLNLADMEAILADRLLLRELSPEAQLALANEFDAALYKSVQTADDLVLAAKDALAIRQTDNYFDELNGIANPPKKPATSPTETRVMPTGKTPELPPEPGAAATEGSATQGAPTSGAVPPTGSAEATVNKVRPLVEKFIDTYNKLRLYYGKNALGEVEVNRLYNDAGNLIEDAAGAGGTRIPLVKSADQVTTATQMMPQYVNQHLIDRIYPKSLYRVSNNAVDWSPKGIRKWIYKMPENMNTLIRHVGSDLYFYGPKAPLRNWVKTGIGLGAASGVVVGVPTLWGLGKSLVSGDSTPAEQYVRFLDGSIVPISLIPFTTDSLRARNPQTQTYVPVVRAGKNWQEETKEAAEVLDAYNNKIAAEQGTSNAPVDIMPENTDSANVNSAINGN